MLMPQVPKKMAVYYRSKGKKTDLDLKINNLIPFWISIFLNYICANLPKIKSNIQHIKNKIGKKKVFTSYDLGHIIIWLEKFNVVVNESWIYAAMSHWCSMSFPLIITVRVIHISSINDLEEKKISKQCLNMRFELPYFLFSLATIKWSYCGFLFPQATLMRFYHSREMRWRNYLISDFFMQILG